jgi:hypothetical protein
MVNNSFELKIFLNFNSEESLLLNSFPSWRSIHESNNFNYKMDEHSSESFSRIYISSWMSIHESKFFNYKMDEH